MNNTISFNDDGTFIIDTKDKVRILVYTSKNLNKFKVVYCDYYIDDYCKLCHSIGMPYFIITSNRDYFVVNNEIRISAFEFKSDAIKRIFNGYTTPKLINMYTLMDNI